MFAKDETKVKTLPTHLPDFLHPYMSFSKLIYCSEYTEFDRHF